MATRDGNVSTAPKDGATEKEIIERSRIGMMVWFFSDTTSYNQDFPIDLKNGLFAACNSVQYITLFVNHAQFQCFLSADTMEKPGSGLQKTVPSIGLTLRLSEPEVLVI